MEKFLTIDYKSQWDADAGMTANDCGPTSIAIVLNYLKRKETPPFTTNQIYKLTGAGSGVINIGQMQKAISAAGFKSIYNVGFNPTQLKAIVDKGLPVIALVHMGDLKSRQDQAYTGGHFLVVSGYRDDGYFVQDPNFQGQYREQGHDHFYTKAEFEKAWTNNAIDQNPNGALIIVQPLETAVTPPSPGVEYLITPSTRNVTITAVNGANLRTAPQTDGGAARNITRALAKGTAVPVIGFITNGESIADNAIWWKLKDTGEWLWSGITNVVPTVEKTPDPIAATTPISDASRQELAIQVERLKDDLKRYIANGIDKDSHVESLKQDLENAQKEINTLKQGLGAEMSLQAANKSLSDQIAVQKMKNMQLKSDRDLAYIKAFSGWSLYELPKGLLAILQSPLFVLRVIGLCISSAKNGYVIGWKKGAKIYQDGTGPAFEQPIANQG